jgi:crotonobetainyl-CoA:carnitine CoA-transferase CaiB-like acyl-CoA transferase
MNTEPFSDNPTQLKVLDLGTAVAGPFATTLLGDLGAEVIKCEQPGTGDTVRGGGMSGRWQMEGRNKRSITLNLRVPEGQDVLRRLVQWADVLVENFRPGTMTKWGIGYEELSKVNPRLVYVAISGFGQTGPYASLSGYDYVGSAVGGMTALTGYPHLPPVVPGLLVVDHTSGLFAAMGALEAVRRRDAPGGTGRGAFIDMALYESVLRYAATDLVDYSLTREVRARAGGKPQGPVQQEMPIWYAYKTRDERWLSICTVTPGQIRDLRALIPDPRLQDKKFDTGLSTTYHAEEYYDIISGWTGERDFDEVWTALRKTSIPAGPINSVQDIVADPHINARGSIVTMKNADGKDLVMPAATPRIDEDTQNLRWTGEPLGASNNHVYSTLLGLSAETLADLRAREVI